MVHLKANVFSLWDIFTENFSVEINTFKAWHQYFVFLMSFFMICDMQVISETEMFSCPAGKRLLEKQIQLLKQKCIHL